MTVGLLSIPPAVQRHRVRPWSRQPRRPWLRPDDVASATSLLAAIPSLPRATLSRLTTRMIDGMDELDGDPDREPTGEDDEDGHDREQEERHA